jgi:hypothetical protein
MSYQPSMTMHLCRQVFAVAVIFIATPSVAELSYGGRLLEHVENFKQYPPAAKAGRADGLVTDGLVSAPFPSFSDRLPDDLEASARPVILVSNEAKREEPDIDMFALMSGKCSTLQVAGRDFKCRAVAYFHSQRGRANFTVALDDPTDNSHIISFSGENARREQDNLYELSIDQMLLNSKDRPKVDGLPVPFVELSAGMCKQLGSFATRQVSSISCSATDKNGKKYELEFESDGAPIRMTRLRQAPLTAKKRRTKQVEQLECRYKADIDKVLRRDLTPYMIRCLAENSPETTTDEPQ